MGITTRPNFSKAMVIFLCFRYQINARTEIAVRYNDMSPLENHHCAISFKILAQPECNIFANCSPELFKEIRAVSNCFLCILCKIIYDMIATVYENTKKVKHQMLFLGYDHFDTSNRHGSAC